MSKPLIVFVHGYNATPESDWYPQIGEILRHKKIDFIVPAMPGALYPQAEEWLSSLHSILGTLERPLILVGHSLGTRAILLYLERYKGAVEKVVLVAPPANAVANGMRRGERYHSFFLHTIDLTHVKPISAEWIVLHSHDDHSVPYAQGVSLAQELEARLVSFNGLDHLGNAENASMIAEIILENVR